MLNKKQGLVKSAGLSQETLAEIVHLGTLCNRHDGLDLKLNWSVLEKRADDVTNDFLYYENGNLVGYLALFSFNTHEAEVSGMVHPEYRCQGIFTQLLSEGLAECERRGISKLLLIVEEASAGGQAFVKTLSTQLDHVEYKMALKEPKLPSAFSPELTFRKAGPEDVRALSQITAVSFDMPEQDVDWYTEQTLNDPDREYYVGALEDKVIGKLDVSHSQNESLILGFGVLPEYQRRGYGRQILARTIQEIFAAGHRHITLEVMVENKKALSLYQSCGFEVTGSYEYYRLK